MPPVVVSRWLQPGPLVLGAILGACLVSAVLLLGGTLSSFPADDSPEAGFARDMATHHAQAAEMAFVIRDGSADQRLRTLAYDIIVTQSAQRGVFMGWLQQWGLSQASTAPRMAWMAGHAHMASSHAAMDTGLMPGMASDAELERLRTASGRDAEVLFLQLMSRHHEGGVLMARALVAQSSRDEVVTMARSIEGSQTGEIALMTEMLAARAAQPYPSILK